MSQTKKLELKTKNYGWEREILWIFPYSVQIREKTNQKNSEYGHFSRSVKIEGILIRKKKVDYCQLLNDI